METWDRQKFDINRGKTKITVLSKRKDYMRNYNLLIKGEQIEIIDEYKYMDMTLNYNVFFLKKYQQNLCQEGRSHSYIRVFRETFN